MQNTIINTAVMFIHVFRSIPMFFKLASEVDRIADKAVNKVNISLSLVLFDASFWLYKFCTFQLTSKFFL